MQRIFFFLVLALIVVVISPPLRSRAETVVRPALNPLYEWNTRNQLKDLHKDLEADRTLGRSIPSTRGFIRWVEERNPGQAAAHDAWGNPLFLVTTRTTFQVGSLGKDGVRGTADDLLGPVGRR